MKLFFHGLGKGYVVREKHPNHKGKFEFVESVLEDVYDAWPPRGGIRSTTDPLLVCIFKRLTDARNVARQITCGCGKHRGIVLRVVGKRRKR